MKLIFLSWVVFLILLPLGSLTRLPIGDIALTVNDIVLPVLIVLWLLYVLVIEKKIILPPRTPLITGFAFWAFITLFYSLRFLAPSSVIVAGLYWVRWVEYAFLFLIGYWLFTSTPGTMRRMRKTILILLGGQIFFVFAGFIQFVLFPNFSRFVRHGWDPHYYRLLSTFLDPNFAGLFLVLGLTFFAALYLMKEPNFSGSPKSKKVLLFYFLITLVAIILTFSRSTYLAMVVAIFVLGMFISRKLILIMAVIGLLSFAFIPKVQTRVIGAFNLDSTVQARFNQYERTINIIEDNPVFGVGFNTFRYAQEQENYFRDKRGVPIDSGHAGAGSDSSLLFILATTGIPGLLIYLSMWGLMVKDAFMQFFNKSFDTLTRSFGLIAGVSLITVMAHTQFVNSMFYPWIMAWMWILLAIMYALRERAKSQ